MEFAAELHDFVNDDLSKYFNKECKKYMKISLVEVSAMQGEGRVPIFAMDVTPLGSLMPLELEL